MPPKHLKANCGQPETHMTSRFGYLVLLITLTFLSGPVRFEITRVDCTFIFLNTCMYNVLFGDDGEKYVTPED